ncbi:ABC transporter permease [Anaerocolumna cellulosilytica]|uniref:ABC transporter permease n=1 Tax=Anaerocolumna cellulosilytica TaxID=433286 RepID=A0A6S6R0G0_9FIRM|nr:ABC transporter permease [Anaerocolumna cellulosilytica]MBB5193987.1 ABC-type antimicrobial peptide transport system permease subunit [Anaerocolumna cellulosilytica]BCJ94799.1 ABC transporter permease [Anaerocolumna cellulosilytica]
MFQNKNTKIIKQLSNSSIKADKRRNLFVILTIAFATCLMLVLALSNLGRSRENKLFLQGRYQASFIKLNNATINSMEMHNSVEKIGRKLDITTQRVDDYTLNIVFKDSAALLLLSSPKLIGHMPEKSNEIIVEQSYLEHIGLTPTLNQQIKLDLGDNNETTYTVCGILKGKNDSRSYQVIPSEALVEAITNGMPLYDTLVRFKDTQNIPTDYLRTEIKNFAKEFNISEKEFVYSSTYFDLAKESSTLEIAAIVIASIMIVVACSLVIYSLFYISVIGKAQAYGRLRIIGTTKKQIKRMVRKEGIKLASIAIPVGLIVGCIISYLLVPKGWHLPTTIISILLITVVTEITIYIAIHTPVKIAASVSPIEAIRITPYTGLVKGEYSKKLHHPITPIRLAQMNFVRNKKKTTLTLLSLGFSGILLMCASAYLNSIDTTEMAKQAMPRGDFNITLNPTAVTDSFIENYTQLQSMNPLNKDLEDALLAIEGVNHIEKFVGCKSELIYPNGEKSQVRVIGLTQQQLNEYKANLLEGTADYDELIKNNGILVADPGGLINQLYGYTAKLDDIISIETDEGTYKKFKVMGIMKNLNIGIDMAFYFVPDDLVPKLKSNVSNFNTHFFVRADNIKLKPVEKQIFNLASQNIGLEVTSINDVQNSLQNLLDNYKMPLYGLIIFISVFGLINLINTLMTNLISRQQEFGMLQSIGLSNKQLSHVIQSECLLYILGTLFLTLTIGSICGYLLCSVFNQVGIYGKLTYHFPVLELALYFTFLLLIQFLFSYIAMNILRKKPLVQRIKMID